MYGKPYAWETESFYFPPTLDVFAENSAFVYRDRAKSMIRE